MNSETVFVILICVNRIISSRVIITTHTCICLGSCKKYFTNERKCSLQVLMELACTFNICWSNYIFYPSFLYGLHFTTRCIMTGQMIFTIVFTGRSLYLIKKRHNLLQLKIIILIIILNFLSFLFNRLIYSMICSKDNFSQLKRDKNNNCFNY